MPCRPHPKARELTQTAIGLLCTAAEGGAVEHMAAMTIACTRVEADAESASLPAYRHFALSLWQSLM